MAVEQRSISPAEHLRISFKAQELIRQYGKPYSRPLSFDHGPIVMLHSRTEPVDFLEPETKENKGKIFLVQGISPLAIALILEPQEGERMQMLYAFDPALEFGSREDIEGINETNADNVEAYLEAIEETLAREPST